MPFAQKLLRRPSEAVEVWVSSGRLWRSSGRPCERSGRVYTITITISITISISILIIITIIIVIISTISITIIIVIIPSPYIYKLPINRPRRPLCFNHTRMRALCVLLCRYDGHN